MVGSEVLARLASERELAIHDSLGRIFASDLPDRLGSLLYRPSDDSESEGSMAWAEQLIDNSNWPLLPNLLPIMAVDERSFACVVLDYATLDAGEEPMPGVGAVVRWHLDIKDSEHQASLLDTDCLLYVESMVEELSAREVGYKRMLDQIGPAYELEYFEAEKRPRDFVVRPVRIACQNVIIGYAAFAHDSAIDGMSVPAWQTCEVPHVATHEAARALAALTLCDAYQSGGTMEIRFDRKCKIEASGTTAKTGTKVEVNERYDGHPEMQVPASLRRYGRTVGVLLGSDQPGADRGAISPSQARSLFRAVTPMPPDLAERVDAACAAGIATPERLCYTLLAQVWREIELDYLLAVSTRTASILEGGADWRSRGARQAESMICRAALMVGMLYRRLDTKDGAGDQTADARVLEDNRVGVTWEVIADSGAVRYRHLGSGPVPWQDRTRPSPKQLGDLPSLVVLPRLDVTAEDIEIARRRFPGETVCVAIPGAAKVLIEADALADVIVLRCPDRLAELDQAIERKLLSSRISRS